MKDNKEKRPFITVKETLVSVLIILMVAIAFEKPFSLTDINTIPLRNVSYQETLEFIPKIQAISISQITENIEKTNGKPTLMVMYTSWCSYCKRLLKNVIALKNENKISGINLLFLSVDRDKSKLSKYLLQYNYDKVFAPNIVEEQTEKELKYMIMSKGGWYSQAIPYSVIFDGNGNLIEEINGTLSKGLLIAKLNDAIDKSKNK